MAQNLLLAPILELSALLSTRFIYFQKFGIKIYRQQHQKAVFWLGRLKKKYSAQKMKQISRILTFYLLLLHILYPSSQGNLIPSQKPILIKENNVSVLTDYTFYFYLENDS
jgi:predicted membrane protein